MEALKQKAKRLHPVIHTTALKSELGPGMWLAHQSTCQYVSRRAGVHSQHISGRVGVHSLSILGHPYHAGASGGIPSVIPVSVRKAVERLIGSHSLSFRLIFSSVFWATAAIVAIPIPMRTNTGHATCNGAFWCLMSRLPLERQTLKLDPAQETHMQKYCICAFQSSWSIMIS